VPVGEIFQDFFRVVTDGRQLDSLLLESWDSALQLDQLPLAERSPIRRTEKEKSGAVRSFQRFESLYPPKLVARRKNRRLLAGREADGHQLNGSYLNRAAIECPPNGLGVTEVGRYRFLRLQAVHDPVRIVI